MTSWQWGQYMASQAKIAANQRNVLPSTGPRAARAKARAQRHALQHGPGSRCQQVRRASGAGAYLRESHLSSGVYLK